MPPELRELERRARLQAMGIEVWLLRGACDMDQHPTVDRQPGASVGRRIERPAAPPAAVTATQACTHTVLLVGHASAANRVLLRDILRHFPILANADDDLLDSHIVTPRQLQSLKPRILLVAGDVEIADEAAVDALLRFDPDRLVRAPDSAKPGLWEQLRDLLRQSSGDRANSDRANSDRANSDRANGSREA